MKTRILHTKVWKDEYFYNLEDKERLAFLYLMTNENVNMIGTYELNDVEFRTWLKTTPDSLATIKQKFQEDCKFLFCDGWVHIVNHDKYNSYGSGMQTKAYERELSLVPTTIKEFFNTSIDTSMHTRHKSKIRNKKLKTRNKKQETAEISSNNYQEIMAHYNEVFEKSTKSYASWQENAEYWLNTYSLEEIKQAITIWKSAKGWLGSLDEKSLTLLFRTKNKAGACDYINDLLNQKSSKKLSDDPLAVATREALARQGKRF